MVRSPSHTLLKDINDEREERGEGGKGEGRGGEKRRKKEESYLFVGVECTKGLYVRWASLYLALPRDILLNLQ